MMSVFAKRRQVVSAEALSGGEPNAGNNGCVWGRGGESTGSIPYPMAILTSVKVSVPILTVCIEVTQIWEHLQPVSACCN